MTLALMGHFRIISASMFDVLMKTDALAEFYCKKSFGSGAWSNGATGYWLLAVAQGLTSVRQELRIRQKIVSTDVIR